MLLSQQRQEQHSADSASFHLRVLWFTPWRQPLFDTDTEVSRKQWSWRPIYSFVSVAPLNVLMERTQRAQWELSIFRRRLFMNVLLFVFWAIFSTWPGLEVSWLLFIHAGESGQASTLWFFSSKSEHNLLLDTRTLADKLTTWCGTLQRICLWVHMLVQKSCTCDLCLCFPSDQGINQFFFPTYD